MKVINKWLTELHTQKGLDYFFTQYKMSPWEIMVKYNLNLSHHINWVTSPVRYIIILDSDNEINQLFNIEETDHLKVYSDERCDGLFNTDGMAFLQLFTPEDKKTKALYSIENSPYDVSITETAEELEISEEAFMKNINEFCQKYELFPEVSQENTVFVKQL